MPNEDIAKVLAAIIAIGLALQSAVGPVVMYITEAIKSAFKPKSGYAGLIALGVAVVLGVVIGVLTAATTPDTGVGTYAAFGAIAGVFMAAGAVKTYKAAGSINPATDSEPTLTAGSSYGLGAIGTYTPISPAPVFNGYSTIPAEPEEVPEGEPDFTETAPQPANMNSPSPLVFASNAEADKAASVVRILRPTANSDPKLTDPS